MPRYQIKPGFRHGKNNEHRGGDVVELTEHEAYPILFKLIPLDEARLDAPTAPGLTEPSFEELFGDDIAVKLQDAGLSTLAQVKNVASDLEDIPGIGRVTADKIRGVLEGNAAD